VQAALSLRGDRGQRWSDQQTTGCIYKSALEVAVGNDKIARRYSGLAERLNRVIAECADGSN
jgi:hypothetical protein